VASVPAGRVQESPSLPWNNQEPLCGPPVPQVAPDRRGQSYRFSFDQVMRSLSSHALIVPGGAIIPLEITNPDTPLSLNMASSCTYVLPPRYQCAHTSATPQQPLPRCSPAPTSCRVLETAGARKLPGWWDQQPHVPEFCQAGQRIGSDMPLQRSDPVEMIALQGRKAYQQVLRRFARAPVMPRCCRAGCRRAWAIVGGGPGRAAHRQPRRPLARWVRGR
jgi:hypothetical protein